MYRLRFVLILGLSFFYGCSLLGGKPKVVSTKVEAIQSAKIIDLKQYQKGGKLVIVPFSAGAGVEASKDSDRIALKIVQGMVEVLHEQSSQFTVVLGEAAHETDLVLRGYITGLQNPRLKDKFLLRGPKRMLMIRGKMTDRQTGEAIWVFTGKKESLQPEDDFLHLGYLIGRDIGQYLTQDQNAN